MSAIEDVLDEYGTKYYVTKEEREPKIVIDARAELAALRAQVALLDDYATTIRAHEITLAGQARALDEARKVIERCSAYIGSIDHGENTKSYMMCDAWLTVHPAPSSAAEPQPREIVTLLDATLKQMIRIGNALNWNPPIDADYTDAINAIRAALQPEAEPQP